MNPEMAVPVDVTAASFRLASPPVRRLRFRPALDAPTAAFLLAVFLALPANLLFWDHLAAALAPLDGHAWRTMAELALALVALNTAVLMPFAGRWLLRPLATLLLLTSALVAYFMNQYGVMIDAAMIANVVQTDVGEAASLFTAKLVVYLVVLGVLPALLLWRLPLVVRPWRADFVRRAVWFVAAAGVVGAVVFAGYQDLASVFRNHRELRFVLAPANYLQALSSYLRHRGGGRPVVVEAVGSDARKGAMIAAAPRPVLTVIVVGETARADHFALNGYERPTTPRLQGEAGLVSLANASSCGTATAISVPCMFSNLGRENFSEAGGRAREGLLDVLRHAGFDVLWRDNNSGCKGVCDRIENEDLSHAGLADLCAAGECYDEVLLAGLQARIDRARGDTVIVLHQKGSHGPAYYQRYPERFARFGPACQTSQIDRCQREEVVNAFDNTILYTDHFLAETLAVLKANASRFATAMIYMSDHGESLGERGLYLHGAPYAIAPEAQTHIPALLWFSDEFRRDLHVDLRCLDAGRQQPASHDQLFHTVLGLLDVHTTAYDSRLDLAAACRGGATKTVVAATG